MQVAYFLSLESHREPADPSSLPSRPCFPDHLAITSLGGPDRAKYLQGQVTCDVNALQPGPEHPGRPLRSQGQAVERFRLLCLEDSLLMPTKPSVLARQLPELKPVCDLCQGRDRRVSGQPDRTGRSGDRTTGWHSTSR